VCRVWQGGWCGIGECDGVYAAAAVYAVSSVCVCVLLLLLLRVRGVCLCVCVCVV